MRLESAGRTHVGLKRPHNEDCLSLVRDQNLFIVADGMGGHLAGEVASQMSVETLANFYRATAEDEDITWPFKAEEGHSLAEARLVTGIRLSNQRVFDAGHLEQAHRGMGTTLVALHFDGDQGVIANVGDSRIYRLRDGGLSRLTEDHSLVEQIRKARPMTDEEAAVYPQNIILRALGKSPSVEVDAHTERVQVGDLYLLCSDGLSGMVKDDVIAEIMSSDSTVEAMADQLIDAANQSGGKDNITVIVIKVCPDVG